jgi:hypothetical protein
MTAHAVTANAVKCDLFRSDRRAARRNRGDPCEVALELRSRFFPDEEIPVKSMAMLEDLLASQCPSAI